MNSTPCSNNMAKLRTKRRLDGFFPSSPGFTQRTTPSQFEMNPFEICLTNEIKYQLTFDEDSTDSGFQNFNDLIVTTPYQTIPDNSMDFSVLCDRTNTHESSASKRTKLIENNKYDDAEIKNALENDDYSNLLIGDKTKGHVLPLLENKKHRDLASISSDTLGDLLAGKYSDEVENYLIIDARYPYEYEGGHIEGALNLYLIELLTAHMFQKPVVLNDKNKRTIIVFHCEFSSERGPRLMREIRKLDRMLNKNAYPSLSYPELYLLEGGYKHFFETNKQFCLPRSYKPMLHDEHRNDLKYFRKKSKSWEVETRRRRVKSKLDFI